MVVHMRLTSPRRVSGAAFGWMQDRIDGPKLRDNSLVNFLNLSTTDERNRRVSPKLRIPAKLTDESDDVDRVVSCGAWGSDFSVVGHHRCRFSVLEIGCTPAGQPGSPASAWTEVAGHWVAPV